jgi:hypothetical protein
MDHANLFETPGTYRLLRLEYALGAAAATAALVKNRRKVRLASAIALFAYPDAIGYLPGARAYRKSPDGRISKAYYVLYNAGHSVLTAAAVAALWARFVRPEAALLVIPAHLCADRALFGNFMKPFSVDFEPKPHPAYVAVRDALGKPAADPPLAPASSLRPAHGEREAA